MGRDRRTRDREPWDPTPTQEEAALRLAAADGAWVRTYVDGRAALMTQRSGTFEYYELSRAGRPTMTGSESHRLRYRFSLHLSQAGFLLSFGSFVPAALEHNGYVLPRWLPPWPVLFGTGLLMFVVSLLLEPRPHPPADERWTRIGGPSE